MSATTLGPEEKHCPFCAEVIKAAAIRCRFCGSDLPTPEVEPSEVEPPEVEPVETPEPSEVEPVETPRQRGLLLTAALVVAVLIAGAGLCLAVRHANGSDVAPDGELASPGARAAIMVQAEKMTETVMSYRAAHAAADIATAERLMTPAMRKKYEASLPPASDRPQQAQMNVTVTATVASLSGKNGCEGQDCAAALVSASRDRARVLVFVDQDATAKSSKGTVASPTWELVTLVKRDGSWVIDDMAAA